eukprot:g1560.t1
MAEPLSEEARRECVLGYYEAVCDGDVERVLSFYEDDATVEDPIGSNSVQQGKEQLSKFYAAALSSTSPRIRSEGMYFAPSRVYSRITSSGLMGKKRFIIHGNQEFKFSARGKIQHMGAAWNQEDLSTPLKTCIVTGGGSGIGEAIVRRLSDDGFQVIIADRSKEAGEALAKEMNAHFVELDVSKPDEVERLVAEVVETFGGLDVMVANAGVIGPIAATADYSVEDWRAVTAVNMDGVFYCLKHAAKQMSQQPHGGAIISTSSTSGLMGFPFHAPYTAAKGAIISLTRAMAVEYGQQGVRVNCVCPGTTKTNLASTDGLFHMANLPQTMEDAITEHLPLSAQQAITNEKLQPLRKAYPYV